MTGTVNIFKHGNYEFVCWYWENSNAWGHEVRLVKGGIEVAKARVRYYNRTWERYTFQSAMYEVLAQFKQIEIGQHLDNYKYKHEIEKFKRGQRAQALAEFEESNVAKDIKELEEFVKEGK